MKRSALEKRANISNNPEIIKLYKKRRNYAINLSRKIFLNSSEILANHSFQTKYQVLTTKLYCWKKEK